MTRHWKRVRDGIYELQEVTVVARVIRHTPPNNSHFSLWTTEMGEERQTGYPSLRDAKQAVDRIMGEPDG